MAVNASAVEGPYDSCAGVLQLCMRSGRHSDQAILGRTPGKLGTASHLEQATHAQNGLLEREHLQLISLLHGECFARSLEALSPMVSLVPKVIPLHKGLFQAHGYRITPPTGEGESHSLCRIQGMPLPSNILTVFNLSRPDTQRMQLMLTLPTRFHRKHKLCCPACREGPGTMQKCYQALQCKS